MPFTSSSCSPQKSAICRKVSVVFSTSQTAVAFCINGSAIGIPSSRNGSLPSRKLGCAGARRSVFAGSSARYIERMRSMLKAFSPPALGLAAALAAPAAAEDFDYWLLALTWSPSWCRDEADPGAEQCDPDRDLGFILHGLWPQYEDGWPEDCASPHRDPTRRQTAAMADIMGSGDLAWYQWKKHGRCAGLPPTPTSRPPAAPSPRSPRRAPAAGRAPPTPSSAASSPANPGLDPDGLIVTCRDRPVREVRICLDRDLAPRPCGADVLAAACRSRGPLDLPPAP